MNQKSSRLLGLFFTGLFIVIPSLFATSLATIHTEIQELHIFELEEPKSNWRKHLPFVAIGETTLVASYPQSSGIHGYPVSGEIQIFSKGAVDTQWTPIKTIYNSDPPDERVGDRLGSWPLLDGDTLMVAALGDDDDAGAIFVYERNLGGVNNWGFRTKIVPDVRYSDQEFGRGALDGDTLVVGTPNAGTNYTGEAFIFSRNEGGADNWGQVKRLEASNASINDFFGSAVAVHGTIVVVSAPRADGGNGLNSGIIYVFEQDEGGANNWGEAHQLVSNTRLVNELLGEGTLEFDGDLLYAKVKHAYTESEPQGGITVFEFDGPSASDWSQLATIRAPVLERLGSDSQNLQRFDVQGDRVVMQVTARPLNQPNLNTSNVYILERDQGGVNNYGLVSELLICRSDADGILPVYNNSSAYLALYDEQVVLSTAFSSSNLLDPDTHDLSIYAFDLGVETSCEYRVPMCWALPTQTANRFGFVCL